MRISDWSSDVCSSDLDDDLTLADFVGSQDYALAAIDPVPGKTSVRNFVGDYSGFELNTLDSQFESCVADFLVKKDIYAGYLLGRYEDTALRVIGGVRVEHKIGRAHVCTQVTNAILVCRLLL